MHVACDGLAEVLSALYSACFLWPSKVWTGAEHMISSSTGYNYGYALNPTASIGRRELVNSYFPSISRVSALVLPEATFVSFLTAF